MRLGIKAREKGKEMKTLWGWSTGIFVLQIMVSGVTHLLGGNPGTVAFVAAIAPLFAVLFIAALMICASFTRDSGSFSATAFRVLVAFVTISAACAAIGVSALTSAPAIFSIVSTVVAFAALSGISAMLAAAFAAGFAPKENFGVLFLSALPFGIGTVGGGVIFLLRRCCAAKNVAA